jgi:hypothetical protein
LLLLTSIDIRVKPLLLEKTMKRNFLTIALFSILAILPVNNFAQTNYAIEAGKGCGEIQLYSKLAVNSIDRFFKNYEGRIPKEMKDHLLDDRAKLTGGKAPQ